MGLNIVKFHSIVHMTQDILNFGVPMEFDTGSNESGHKSTKKAAKLTQKKEETFTKQDNIRLQEEHLLQLALYEEIHGRPVWNYSNGHQYPVEVAPNLGLPRLGAVLESVHASLVRNLTFWYAYLGANRIFVELVLQVMGHYFSPPVQCPHCTELGLRVMDTS